MRQRIRRCIVVGMAVEGFDMIAVAQVFVDELIQLSFDWKNLGSRSLDVVGGYSWAFGCLRA